MVVYQWSVIHFEFYHTVTDDALNSAKAGDSIAVQTGSYHSDRATTLTEDSDVSTTADEISTEVSLKAVT